MHAFIQELVWPVGYLLLPCAAEGVLQAAWIFLMENGATIVAAVALLCETPPEAGALAAVVAALEYHVLRWDLYSMQGKQWL